ncbi:hypothetical protein M9H77_24300 [Catharanthus roseus]|uniref:Uncharacterized protein n=1 Tax=Catharanthus roseus TaxID=4058 RepID=A0ACC0AVC2_CATRO|nr:hypothetical protein M9H77_24300 [Catharanthus roseus]
MIMKEEAHRKLLRNIDTGSEAMVFATPKSVECTHCFKPEHEAENCYLLVGFPTLPLEHWLGDRNFNEMAPTDGEVATDTVSPEAEAATAGVGAGRPWAGQSDPAEAAPFSSFAASSTDHSHGWAAAASNSALEDAEHNSAAQTAMTGEPSLRYGTAATAAGKLTPTQTPSAHPFAAHLVSAQLPAAQAPSIQLSTNPHPPAQSPVLLT